MQATLLYLSRLSIKMEGQIRSFPDKRGLKEYTSIKPALQDMLKDCSKKRKKISEREKQRYKEVKWQ